MRTGKSKKEIVFAVSIGAALMLVLTAVAGAHFQMVVPSVNIIGADDPKEVNLDIMFAHPMEGPTMDMKKPVRFGVVIGGEEKKDLLPTLQETKIGGHIAYKTSYKVGRPGDYIFYIEPAPYWEQAEEKMIIHYTKVVVGVMGEEKGWDAEVGLPVEIIPLTRPYGLWTGNLFQGIVKQDGKPVPFAGVEVEYYNKEQKVKPPSDPYITQVVKADGNGVFSYAMPKAGWWGFAALCDGPKMKNQEGKEVDVELGGLFWVYCVDMK
jgi:cobalt/nickel transport protein